jgi:SAM-dependent methyltransferase
MDRGQPCCYDETFDERHARERLREYRRRGARGLTRRLIEALRADGVAGATVLDIGGGVGAVHLALLEAGAARAIDVDASGPFLATALDEATRLGLADRVDHRKGDFVAVADTVPVADVVALDRVICCYHDDSALLAAAASHARRRVGFVAPRDAWWTRAGSGLMNGWQRLRRDPFRFYVHRSAGIAGTLRAAGLERSHLERGWFWQLEVFERRPDAAIEARIGGG